MSTESAQNRTTYASMFSGWTQYLGAEHYERTSATGHLFRVSPGHVLTIGALGYQSVVFQFDSYERCVKVANAIAGGWGGWSQTL